MILVDEIACTRCHGSGVVTIGKATSSRMARCSCAAGRQLAESAAIADLDRVRAQMVRRGSVS